LSFAQFEREVIGERIRDKVAASRKRGMWMGGVAPMGYRVQNRKLVVHKPEAAVIRMIFERFLKVGSATALARQLRVENVRSHRGRIIDKGSLYRILRNRVYIGLAVHKGVAYPGEHAPIVSQALWDKAQSILRESPRMRACRSRAATPALLKGLLFGPTGRAMSPTHTRRGSKLYRYYVCQAVLKGSVPDSEIQRVSAARFESAVVDQLRVLLKSPEVVVATWRAAAAEGAELSEATVRETLERLDPLWAQLFPAEQARIVQLLVQRIDLKPDGLELRLRTHGLGHVVQELGVIGDEIRRAA
jgi:site-specific DNA recombinase